MIYCVGKSGLAGKIFSIINSCLNISSPACQDLKYPPVGMESNGDSASSWPWFHLMNEAMEGRLGNSAPLLTPITQDDEQQPDAAPRHRPCPAPPPLLPLSSTNYRQDVFNDTSDQDQQSSEVCERSLEELEREWEMVERERAAVVRERASVEREKAAVQADRLWLEQERAAVERDRALVDQERTALEREREVLDQRALMLNSVGHTGHLNAMM